MKAALRMKFRRFCISRPRLLWRRYALGFLFIFATISASHWATLATIEAAEDDAEVLHVSARQRMLSQRILFLMSETERPQASEGAAERLEAALDLFESSHNWLTELPDLSPALQELYFEKQPISLDAFSRRFVSMVGIVSTADDAQRAELQPVLAQWGKEDLIASLATAADLFKQESEDRIATLQIIQQLTLYAALLVLLLEALLIFLPAQISVNAAIRRLEVRKKLLKGSMNELKTRNRELTSARKKLTRAANQDPLTELFNRRAIYQKLNTPSAESAGADCMLVIMKLDLDEFKQVNDTHGHSAGDALLVHVARTLRRHCAPVAATAGRIGGDEFVILLEHPSSLEEINAFADQIIADIAKPLTLEGVECRVGASIGYTVATSTAATCDQMLIEADLALYEAKRAGRGRYCAYSTKLAEEIETRRHLFNEITRALANDQFEPYLQPQVFTDSGEIYGCEVLARWRHPERGIVPPATFIAAAEEAGLVGQIDRMMIEKGLDLLERFLEQGIDLPSISVNASPQTLRDPHLTDRLLQDVYERHLAPGRLTVEVLESTLIENDDDVALRTIERLAEAGFAVVMDDFGTGYASMSNLSRLHLTGIKLDQSLIRPVPDPRADSIISALVTLAESLDMRVVAEGVETKEHFDTVTQLGCDVVQGFGVGHPMDEADFVQWYRAYSRDRSFTHRWRIARRFVNRRNRVSR